MEDEMKSVRKAGPKGVRRVDKMPEDEKQKEKGLNGKKDTEKKKKKEGSRKWGWERRMWEMCSRPSVLLMSVQRGIASDPADAVAEMLSPMEDCRRTDCENEEEALIWSIIDHLYMRWLLSGIQRESDLDNKRNSLRRDGCMWPQVGEWERLASIAWCLPSFLF